MLQCNDVWLDFVESMLRICKICTQIMYEFFSVSFACTTRNVNSGDEICRNKSVKKEVKVMGELNWCKSIEIYVNCKKLVLALGTDSHVSLVIAAIKQQ